MNLSSRGSVKRPKDPPANVYYRQTQTRGLQTIVMRPSLASKHINRSFGRLTLPQDDTLCVSFQDDTLGVSFQEDTLAVSFQDDRLAVSFQDDTAPLVN